MPNAVYQVALERESGAVRDVEADCDPSSVPANAVVAAPGGEVLLYCMPADTC